MRVVIPSAHCDHVLALLLEQQTVVNVIVIRGVAQRPDGDLVQFDVPREAGNDVLEILRSQDLHHDGSISVEQIELAFSDAHRDAEAHAPGDPSEAVIWEEVDASVREQSSLSLSFLMLLVIAVLIGAVAILSDSAILIVGAMVVGPEFSPLASVALGLHKKRLPPIRRGSVTLLVGFSLAIGVAALFGWCIRALGQVPDAYELGQRPVTDFISQPDLFTLIVASLAGVAGMLSLTEGKSGTLVGALISVTTVPAASNVGVALAFGHGQEAWGAFQQLLLNVLVIVLVGAATLRFQAWVWNRNASPDRQTSRDVVAPHDE